MARLGGDEFTILLDDIRDPSDAVRVAERIQQAVRAPVSMGGGQEVFATASIGIAISVSVNSSDEDLVRDADIAMYRAKASGGDQCAVFDATMHERAVERLQLETDLRRAIEREEFRLQYQPIVSLRDHRVIGFEALIRWQHPERGLLSPAAFLALAEETGLITRINQWVLREACAQARRWQTQFPAGSPASVSVTRRRGRPPGIAASGDVPAGDGFSRSQPARALENAKASRWLNAEPAWHIPDPAEGAWRANDR